MTATELLNYIYTNNKIEYILEDMGCHGIRKNPKEWRCGLPKHTNKTTVSIKDNKYLNVNVYSDDSMSGNLFNLIMNLKDLDFVGANKYLHNKLGLKYKYKKKVKSNAKSPVDIFLSKKSSRQRFDVKEMQTYDESILEEYAPNLHINWLKEGIVSFTGRKFNIGYDYRRQRIIIPHRMWHGESNEIVGIMGRTTIPNFELLDIPKYFPIKKYLKGNNLYGLYENYESIQSLGYVTVFEGEKSVLKRHSRLDPSGVALCHNHITEEQVKILIGLNVEIVIAMDQGIKIEHIWSLCDKFNKVRKVSYIWDDKKVLEKKESPADKLDKIYMKMFQERKIYDENDRKKLKKWEEKRHKR